MRPILHLLKGHVRTAEETEFGFRIRIFPYDRVVVFYLLQDFIRNNKCLGVWFYEIFTLLLCLRCQVLYVVKTYCAV